MGTTYFVANVAKRQYFDPGSICGGNSKRSGILWGMGGHALALLLLPDAKLDFHLVSWVGDPLVLVGDETSPNSIEVLKPLQHVPEQDAYHIATEQFDDITLNLIALLGKQERALDCLLDSAERHSNDFVHLAHAMMYLSARHIEIAFIKRFGANWRDRYDSILASEPHSHPNARQH